MTVHVIVGHDGDEDQVHAFTGPEISWITEPSGALIVFDGKKPVAGYAPGRWEVVRRAD